MFLITHFLNFTLFNFKLKLWLNISTDSDLFYNLTTKISTKLYYFCKTQIFSTEHLNLIEALNGPVVKSETGTLSRASSMSINSRRSAARNALSRQEIVNEFSQQHRSSIENSSDTIELHDIVIQSEA